MRASSKSSRSGAHRESTATSVEFCNPAALLQRYRDVSFAMEALEASARVQRLGTPLLAEGTREAVIDFAAASLGRTALEDATLLAAQTRPTPLPLPASSLTEASAVGVQTVMTTTLRCAGRAAFTCGAVDGLIATVGAVHGLCTGSMTTEEAATHVATEATGGAVAGFAGVGAAALFTAATGGTGPVVVGVAMGASMAAKQTFNWLFSSK